LVLFGCLENSRCDCILDLNHLIVILVSFGCLENS
jgi:hypothetical protein